jgi:hypothetical protein
MDKAELILYGVATYLAIKSLVTLMSEHRQSYKKKLAEELKASAAAAPPTPAPTTSRTAAANQPVVGARATAKTPAAEAKPQAVAKT